jgi:hypothetical protein
VGYLNRSTPGALILRNAGDVAVHAVAFGILFWGLFLASEVTRPVVALLPWLYAVGLPATKAWQFDVQGAVASAVTSARRELLGVALKWVVGFPLGIFMLMLAGLLALRWLLTLSEIRTVPGAALVDLTWSLAFLPSLVALVVATATLCVFAGGVSLAVRVGMATRGG